MKDLWQRLQLFIDVTLGHNLIMNWEWLPENLQAWWYTHVCLPAGTWECRE